MIIMKEEIMIKANISSGNERISDVSYGVHGKRKVFIVVIFKYINI